LEADGRPEGRAFMIEISLPAARACGDTTCRATLGYSAQMPERAYADLDEWCPCCWKQTSEVERLHLLYDVRLRRYLGRQVRGFAGARTVLVTEEIDQEVMIDLFVAWERLKWPERVMWRIADRKIAVRRARYEKVEAPEPAEAPEAEDEIEAIIDRRALEDALAKLPPTRRKYLLERKGHGDTDEEVAERHGVSPSTVKEQSRRGLSDLEGLLRVISRFVTIIGNAHVVGTAITIAVIVVTVIVNFLIHL
jgi:RNA polymerase sigma factor (sigma-70 family)